MATNTSDRDNYPAMGDDEAQVVNVSSSGWPGSQAAIRGSHPGQHRSPQTLPHRHPVMVDAMTSETMDAATAMDLMRAAQHEARVRHAEQNDRSVTGYIRHVFGLNLPGRDREV
jgi:hypothetical protein